MRMTRNKALAITGVLVLLNIIDIITTMLIARHDITLEANPIAFVLLQYNLFLPAKIGASLFILYATTKIYSSKSIYLFWATMIPIYTLTAINNISFFT